MAALYSSMSVQTLKIQLKERNLPVGGQKVHLVQRLRDADWDNWMLQNKIFSPFPRFPVKIQRHIWKLSLPGPRLLSVEHKHDTEKFYFPVEHHTPNPAALTACRISREVAITRYRPVFGTSHVYADLEGGDMLYFGPWNEDLDLIDFWIWHQIEDYTDSPGARFARLSPAVVADLEQLTHIVLDFDFLKSYFPKDFDEDEEYSGGRSLRVDLRKFKGLKMVSLCCGGTDRFEYLHVPGQVVLEVDQANFEKEDEEDAWSQYPREMLDQVIKTFHLYPSQKEKENGMPAVQLVEAHRISDPQHRLRIDGVSVPNRVISSQCWSVS